jgi:hypothetical protein
MQEIFVHIFKSNIRDGLVFYSTRESASRKYVEISSVVELTCPWNSGPERIFKIEESFFFSGHHPASTYILSRSISSSGELHTSEESILQYMYNSNRRERSSIYPSCTK